MRKTRLASAISMALLSIGTVGSVQAQEAGATRGLEQVIVQARRTEENVQDVPLAITALSAEQLEKANIRQVSDLVQSTPSVQMSTAIGRQEAAFFAIRGQRSDDVLLTADQAVAVIVGGVPVNWAYGVGLMGTLDVSSLEVAKGPQGTLFGKNSTGGAIIITPAEPDNSLEGSIKAGIGNYNEKDLEGMINVPLADTLAARLAVGAHKRDGWGENLDTGKDFNSTDNWSARASLKWQPTDQLSSLLVVEGGYSSTSATLIKNVASNSNTFLGSLYAQADVPQANDGFWQGRSDLPNGGSNDMKTWGVLNTTTYEVTPNLTIKNIIGVRDLWYEGIQDNDGSNGAFITAPSIFNHLTTIPFQFTSAQSVTEELQISGSQDIADWIAGLYYSHTDGKDGAISQQYNSVGNLILSGPTGGVVNQTIAAFTQSTWHLTDALNLTTGLRFTQDDREVTYEAQRLANLPFQAPSCLLTIQSTPTLTNPTGAVAPSPCELQKNKSYHQPTGNLSLDYKLTDSQLVYAAYRRGYRSGGLPGRGQGPVTSKPFDPETVNDFEVGYKIESDIAGMPYRVNTAVFQQYYKNIQRNITIIDVGALATTVANAAAGTISGGELEFTFLPIDSLELTGYLSYIDAKYEKWMSGTIDRSSNSFPGVAQESAGMTVRYTLPLPASVGDVAVAVNAYYQTEVGGYVDNKVDGSGNECKGSMLDGYTVLGARLDWDNVLGMDNVKVGAWGKNLANEKYYTSALCLYNNVGNANAYPGEPRTFGVTAQYKF